MPYNPCCCTPATCNTCQDGDPATIMMAFSNTDVSEPGTSNPYWYLFGSGFIWPYCGDNADGSWEIPKLSCTQNVVDRLPVNCSGLAGCNHGSNSTQFYTFTRTQWGSTNSVQGTPFYSGECLVNTGFGSKLILWEWRAWALMYPVPEFDGFHLQAELGFSWRFVDNSAGGNTYTHWCWHVHEGRICEGLVFGPGNMACHGGFGVVCTITM